MVLQAGKQSGLVGEQIAEIVSVHAVMLANQRHFEFASIPLIERNAVGVAIGQGNAALACLVDDAARKIELQIGTAAKQVLYSGHGDEAIAAKLRKDRFGDGVGHVFNSRCVFVELFIARGIDCVKWFLVDCLDNMCGL